MSDFKLKLLLTVLSSLVFSLIFVILALVLPTHDTKYEISEEVPQTEFERMSKGMREGFKK